MFRNNYIKRWAPIIALIILTMMLGIVPALADGHVEPFVDFDREAFEFPEGVAVDKVGNVFVSLDIPRGEVRKISPDGSMSVLADFGTPGAPGMAVDAPGNVYVARQSVDPNIDSQGVYRITPDGSYARLPGTEAIVFPNSLAFDKRGNLYVTETFSLTSQGEFDQGGIWRIPPNGTAELWLRHPTLTGLNDPNIPVPFPIGANGIAYRHGELFVANTEKGHIVRIPIAKGGGPGEPVIMASGPDLLLIDGIALDVHGDIYAAIITQSKVVRVDVETGDISDLATMGDGLDFPSSLAFGTGKSNRQKLFVTNYAIGPPDGAGPGILKVDAGVPGLPLP